MNGRLYGIGVGPGDPELLTRKAMRLIAALPVLAYPAPDHGKSFARAIVADLIPADTREIPMIVPMRAADRIPAQDVYACAAEEIASHLAEGRDVGVLCEGDPFFFGSFMYLFARLAGRFSVEIVPGVSSLGACAAALRRPLTARNDVLCVLPGPLPDDVLAARIGLADAVAIMKVGRHLPRLRGLIDRLGLMDRAFYVAHASMSSECAMPLAEAPQSAPYFSIILINKGRDPWLT